MIMIIIYFIIGNIWGFIVISEIIYVRPSLPYGNHLFSVNYLNLNP